MRPRGGAIVRISLVSLLGAACGEPEQAPENSTPADADVRALTREQIREHAEAMSPEVAESLGIVDTTIRIERPMPAESVGPPGPAPDTGASRQP